jgi:membrane-associated phospholipid phosphatase
MYFLYAFFIGMLILGYKSQQMQWRIIGWGYILTQGIGSIFIVSTLKVMVGHARPDQLAKTGNTVFNAWAGPSFSSAYYGFPSGHTCDYLISFFFLAMCLPKMWMRILAIFLALFNGVLRVMLAKHFPFDVLGGVIIGGLTCLAVWQCWVLPRLNKV